MKLKVILSFAVLFFFPCCLQADDILFRLDGSSCEAFLKKMPPELQNNPMFQTDFNIIVQSYPKYVYGVSIEKGLVYLLLSDGTKIAYDDRLLKNFEEKSENPDVKAMLSLLYPLKNPIDKMNINDDPGRFRPSAFFKAVYGKTRKEVRSNLIKVDFCGKTVLFNIRNGAADALKNVGKDLCDLIKAQPHLKKYIRNLGGTFMWRSIAGTNRLSPHSFGIAIDLNPNHASYWHGQKNIAEFSRLNYPSEIVSIFEKYGFIWGGKWYHYDTMHFEFRPELIAKSAKQDAP